jgi:hypothetical protein
MAELHQIFPPNLVNFYSNYSSDMLNRYKNYTSWTIIFERENMPSKDYWKKAE